MSISERIKKIIKDNELNSSSFATKIGVQRSSISHIISVIGIIMIVCVNLF